MRASLRAPIARGLNGAWPGGAHEKQTGWELRKRKEFLPGRLAQLIGRWRPLPAVADLGFSRPLAKCKLRPGLGHSRGKCGLRGRVRLGAGLRAPEGVFPQGGREAKGQRGGIKSGRDWRGLGRTGRRGRVREPARALQREPWVIREAAALSLPSQSSDPGAAAGGGLARSVQRAAGTTLPRRD